MKNTIAIRFRFRARRLRTTLRKRLRALNKKALGVTIAILPIGLAPLASAQSTTTYGSGATTENGNTATTIILDDGAMVTTNDLVAGAPLVYSNNPDVMMSGASVLTITNTDEVFAGLNSISGGASIVLDGGSNITINLGFTGPTTTSPVTNNYNGTITATPGSVLMLTGGTGVISFDGVANSLDLDPVTTLNDARFGNGPIFANVGGCLIGTAGFVVGNGVTANTETEVIADDTSVQVDGVLNLLGDETVEDLYITANGAVDARGALNVRDTLIVDGTLNTSAALCAAMLKGSGTINAGGDVLLFPSTASVVNITFNTTHDFLKFGDGSLTLTQNQGIEGATWVQAGALTLQGTSEATEFIVAESVISPEATGGSAYDGGGVYSDADGNVDSNLLAGKEGSVDPTLNINAAANSALKITIGSNDGVDSGADGNADSATVNTGAANLLADAADVTIYNSANLNLGGDETINSVTFDDTTLSSAETLTSVRGQVTLGGVTTIETLTSEVSGNGVVNMGGNTLNLAGGNSSYEYSGVFNGAVTSILNKDGTGELSLTGNSATDGIFNGTVNVNAGILEVQNNGALGLTGAAGGAGAVSAGGETNVFAGTELQLNNTAFGDLTIADNLNIAGCGVDGATGAIHNEFGNNTLTGQITLTGTSSLFAADGTSLTTTGLITSLAAVDPTLFLDGAGNFDIDGLVDVNISTLYKTGTGLADISGTNHGYQTSVAADGVADTVIQNGVLRIDDVNNLGGVNADVVAFVGDTNNSSELPILDYVPGAASGNATLNQSIFINSGLADAKYATGTRDLILDVGTINVDDNNLTASDSSLTIDLDRLGAGNTNVVFGDTTNGLYKTGTDDLILNAVNSTTVAAPGSTGITGGATIANIGLDPVDVVLGGVLNPSDGNVIVNGPGTTDNGANCFGPEDGSSNFIIAGLGSIDAIAVIAGTNNDGTLIVNDFDNLVVNQSTNTTFTGALNTAANFVYNGNGNPLTLAGSALGTGFSGNIYIGDGRLVAGGDNALGTIAGDYEMASTFICGTHQTDPTQPFDSTNRTDFGILAISGGANIFENITIVNDGLLVNQDSSNTINAPVRLQYDAATDVLGGDEAYGVIGAEDGDLTIANGVFGDTGTNVGLKLNTGTINPADGSIVVAHNGTLNLGPIARDSVQDIQIGHAGSTGTVNLLGANAHEGQTFLFGGNVVAGNTGAFSGGDVIVDGATSLAGDVALGNDIQLNADLTSNEAAGTLRLDGTVSGSGGITHSGAGTLALAGVNNFTGSLNVQDGIVNVFAPLATTGVNVDAGAILNTTGAGLLSASTSLSNEGSVVLGGDQVLFDLSGTVAAATLDIGTFGLTTAQGIYAGGITNSHGQYHKVGGGTQSVGAGIVALGGIHVVNGTLDVTGPIDTAFIDVDAAGTMVLNGGGQFTPTSPDLNIAGGLMLGGNETSASLVLSGDLTGTGVLTSTSGYDLNNGATTSATAHLGTGEVRANGNVTLGGNAGGTVQVQTGVTTASGAITGDVTIADHAALNYGANGVVGGNLNNDGTVNLGAFNDTVVNYNSDGGTLNGTGTLTAGTYNLNNSIVNANLGSGSANASGSVVLNGDFSGDLAVLTGGTTSQNGAVSGLVTIESGATLNSNANIGNAILNSGEVNLVQDITSGAGYVSDGGTLNGGGNTLTSTEYQLNDGSVVNANLGAGAANANGSVAINGDVAGALSVDTGVTTQGAGSTIASVNTNVGSSFNGNGTITGALTNAGTADISGVVLGTTGNSGTLTNSGLLSGDVTNSGTLTSGTDGIADTASLTNSGNLTINGTDTVASLVQNGGRLDGGTITAATYDLNGGTVNADLGAGSATAGGGVTVNGDIAAATLTVDGAATLNGQLTDGAVAVTIDASGALTTGGAERINDGGSVAIASGGSLTLGGNETLASISGAGSIVNSGNDLTVGSGTFSGVISGAGDLIKESNGTLTLSGANTYGGETLVNQGTLHVDGGSLLSDEITVANNATLQLTDASFAANSELVNSGTVQIAGDNSIGNLFGGATGVVDLGTNASDTLTVQGGVYDGLIQGDGGLTKAGTGTLTLNGANTYAGATNVNGGTLQLNGTIASGNVTVDGASLILGSGERINDAATLTVTGGGTITLNGDETVAIANLGEQSVGGTGELIADTFTLNGTEVNTGIAGGTVATGGSGTTTTINAASSADSLTVANTDTLDLNATFDTDVVTAAGTLNLGGADLLNSTAAVDVDGTLNLGGDQTLSTVTGGGSVAIGANDLTLTDQGTFAGGFTGTGNLDIAGNAVLSGTSGFTGDLSISGNFTDVTGSIAAANVDVATGAGLTVNGNSLANSAIVNVDGTLIVNGTETIGRLDASGRVIGSGFAETGGTLNAGVYNLDGATVVTNLSTGILNSDGVTQLEGTSAAGNVNVNSGVLTLGSAERLANSAAVNLTGDLNLTGNETIGSLAGNGNVLTNAGETLTTTGDSSFDGDITGAGGYTVNGGDSSLNNGATYTGATTVTAGALSIGGALASNDLNVATGAELATTAANVLSDSATANVEGALTLGGNDTLTAVTGGGSVAIGASDLTLTDQGTFAGGFAGTGNLDIAGNAVLSGSSSFTGDLAITGGSTNITGSIAAANVDVASGTGLTVNGTSLADTSAVNVDGTFTINSPETIGSLTATGTVDGAGILTAATYDLDGALVNADLGAGVLTSNGATQLNGTSDAEVVNVESGVLALGSDSDLANTAAVNLTGDLDLAQSETIGSLAGTGSVLTNAGEILTTTGDSSFDGDITGAGGYTVNGGGSSLNNGASYTGVTTVTAGALNVGGALASNDLNVASGAVLNTTAANVLSDAANLALAGTLNLGGNEAISELTGNGTINNGGNNLGVDSGSFSGTIAGAGGLTKNSDGALTLSGVNSFTGELDAVAGVLNVSSSIASASAISVDSLATLNLNASSLLGSDADLTVDGIANLQNEVGGTRLNGGGQVNVSQNFDVNGGNYQGDLDVANTLLISGAFTADGALTASVVDLTSAANSQLILNGSLDFGVLVGNGSIVASSFTNDTIIAPNGNAAGDVTGVISISGDYIETGNYRVDVNTLADSDTIAVDGVASLDRGTSIVDLNDPTDALATLGSRTNIIDATGGITGGLSGLNGNGLSSPDLLFDLGTGDVASLGNGTFDAFDKNSQAIVDAIIRGEVDGVNFDSTAASGSLLDGLILSAGAGNVESTISSVSPEAYAGAVDYAMDATRSYSRVARSASALTVIGGGPQATVNVPDAKGETPYTVSLPDRMSVEVIAGFNHFESGSDSSNSGNDYDLNGNGGYAGIRLNGNDGNFMVGLFTGFNDGSISSSSIDLDGEGFIFGAFADFKPQKDGLWTVHADIAGGNFSFDGSHQTRLGSSDAQFDTTAFEIGLGVDYLAYERDGLMVRPSIGFRYLSSTSDSFSENGGAGALNVDAIDASSSLVDLGVEFAYRPHQARYGLSSYLGYQVNLSENDRSVSATFANGTGFEVDAPGYGDGAFVYDFGAHYDVTERFRIHAGVRGEVRTDAETFTGANLGGSFSF